MMTVANNLSTHKNFYELYATQDITLFSEEKAKVIINISCKGYLIRYQ